MSRRTGIVTRLRVTEQLPAWRRRVRRFAVPLAAVGLGFGFVAMLSLLRMRASPIDRPETVIADTSSLRVASPASVVAGADVLLTITGADPGVPVELTIASSYGTSRQSITTASTTVEVVVRPFDVAASGMAIVTVTQANSVASTSLMITAGDVAGPIDVMVGPRSIVADTADRTMIVAFPVDSFGNPAEHGQIVSFDVTRPGGANEQRDAAVIGLFASQIIDSGTVAGRTRVVVRSGSADGAERDFLEVAGLPRPFTLLVVDPIPAADGRTLFRVRTDLLTDDFGNVLPDGVAGALEISTAESVGRLSGQTIAGRIEFHVEAPTRPGTFRLVADIAGQRSQSVDIMIRGALDAVPARIDRSASAASVHVGPVIASTGAIVPDGTTVTVTLAGAAHTATLMNGVAELTVPTPGSSTNETVTLDVEVLGVVTSYRSP